MKISVPVQEYGEYKLRMMEDSDAPAVVALYRAVYGDHFPIKEMYDPDFIIKQQEAGLMYRVVAVDAAGKVLAHHAMYRLEETYHGLYEAGQGMVFPEYRGKGSAMSYRTISGGSWVPRWDWKNFGASR